MGEMEFRSCNDIDLISVVGVNGLTREKVASTVNAFDSNGCYFHQVNGPYSRTFSMARGWVRIGWDRGLTSEAQ